ncbi:hypothetical protein K440DRAFT_625440 [Wilcoxina mikolae CBS 423.85]|nr:hypothetical protein K440DRAFT_625440 [Wilcoxina mikolae CBS 423.85]
MIAFPCYWVPPNIDTPRNYFWINSFMLAHCEFEVTSTSVMSVRVIYREMSNGGPRIRY